jgi:hypothetical protein
MAEVGAATHFQAASAGAGWAGSLAKVAQIGEHIFYRFTGRAGTPHMFKAEPQRSAPDVDANADAGRVHTAFTVATASPAPAAPGEAKPGTSDVKAAAAATPTPSASMSTSKAVEPVAKAPQAAPADVVQPVKAVESEASKPSATTATPS